MEGLVILKQRLLARKALFERKLDDLVNNRGADIYVLGVLDEIKRSLEDVDELLEDQIRLEKQMNHVY